MNDRLNAISFFSGSGQLDRGVAAAFANFGIHLRTVAYIECEEAAQKVILARQRDGLLDAGPVFSDVCRFDGRRVRGSVQVGVGGFPCQPFSVAGKRLGKADERYLFGEIIRVANEAGLSILALENVPGLLQPNSGEDLAVAAGRSVQPPPIGDVAGLLSESGFRCQWISLGAEDVGAPHGRQRWWCLAFRSVSL